MAIDEMKKTRKDLSLKSTNASLPIICAKDGVSVVDGGVSGKKKENMPMAKADAMDR
jgi:hypothetical protein